MLNAASLNFFKIFSPPKTALQNYNHVVLYFIFQLFVFRKIYFSAVPEKREWFFPRESL